MTCTRFFAAKGAPASRSLVVSRASWRRVAHIVACASLRSRAHVARWFTLCGGVAGITVLHSQVPLPGNFFLDSHLCTTPLAPLSRPERVASCPPLYCRLLTPPTRYYTATHSWLARARRRRFSVLSVARLGALCDIIHVVSYNTQHFPFTNHAGRKVVTNSLPNRFLASCCALLCRRLVACGWMGPWASLCCSLPSRRSATGRRLSWFSSSFSAFYWFYCNSAACRWGGWHLHLGGPGGTCGGAPQRVPPPPLHSHLQVWPDTRAGRWCAQSG